MFDLTVFLVYFFAYCLLVFTFIKVVFSYFTPGDSSQNLLTSLSQFLTWLVLWVPTTLSSTLTNLYNNLRTNYPYYILAIALIFASYGVYENQPEVDKVNDGFENDVYFPFMNNFVLPIANFLRMVFDGIICFTNVLGNLGRILRNQFFDITFECSTMDWLLIPESVGKFAIESVNSTVSWMLSGFSEELKIAPMIGHIADVYSALNPLVDCQCNDLNFLWPILIHPDYGIIQSGHLHLFPEAVFNSVFEIIKLPFKSGISIADAVFVGCSGNSTEVRECQVAREPKFEDLSRLSCSILTHSGDFLDDILYSVDTMLQVKLGLFVPWNSTPRPFAMFAMPLCAATDLGWAQLDVVSHIDLFFSLSPSSDRGNYAAELPLETFMSRLYNITDQLEQLGTDIGGTFAENSFCLVSNAFRILFGVIEFILQIARRLLAKNFQLEAVRELMSFPAISDVVDLLETSADDLVACADELGPELGHGGQYFAIGFGSLVPPLVKIVKGIVENSQAGDVLSYLGSFEFNDAVTETYEALLIIAGAFGGSIRSLGGFGTVTCGLRDITENPQDLTEIEMDNMDLNIMCSLGTFVELSLRYPITIFKQLFDIVYAIASIIQTLVVTNGVIGLSDFTDPLANGGAFDIGKPDGIVETQCLWLDSIALFIPSMFTLGDTPITCPSSSSDLVAQRIFDVLRALVRLILLTPFMFVRAVLQTFGRFLCAGSTCANFGTFCSAYLLPLWKVSVVPTLQLFISIVELVNCLVPGIGVLNSIAEAIGVGFIASDYGNNVVVPCDQYVDGVDGGTVIGFFCDFFEAIGSIIEIVLLIFEKGFWQAIWDLISEPILGLLQGIVNWGECIWGNVIRAFTKLVDCGESLIDFSFDPIDFNAYINGIEASCTDWDDIFRSCPFSLSVPQYDLTTPIPTPGGGIGSVDPGSVTPRKEEMWGVCIKPDGTCLSRSSADYDYNGEQCANVPSFGANRFIIGKPCDEINVTETPPATGACCVPNQDCQVTTYAQCNNVAELNNQPHVWSENESCSSLTEECRVVNSPYTTQLGCCITDGDKSPFNFDIRHAVPNMNGYDCYLSAVNVRAYYIPGDRLCNDIETTSIYIDLLNATDSVLDDFTTSPLAFSSEVTQTCCTPEDNIYKSISSKIFDTSCTMFNSKNDLLGEVDVDFVIDPPEIYKIAGSGFDDSDGKWWHCRSSTNWVQGTNDSLSSELGCTVDVNSDVNCFNFGYLGSLKCIPSCLEPDVQNFTRLLGWQGTIGSPFFEGTDQITPFADPNLMALLSVTDRQTRFNTNFVTECRPVYANIDLGPFPEEVNYVYGNWVDQGFGIFQSLQMCIVGADVDGFGNTCVNTECRFRRRPNNIIPRVDMCTPFNNVNSGNYLYFVDELSITSARPNAQTMKILYFTNTTFDLGRDNTDARCNTFIPVDYPPQASPPMAPDEYFEGPVLQTRGLLSTLSNEFENTSHPCHLIYDIIMEDNSSRAINYLMRKELKVCQFSNGLAHSVDSLLMWNSHINGYRLVHPHTFYDSVVGWSTFMNVTRGIAMSFSYVGYVFTEYAFANNTNNTNMTSGVNTWHEYAALNRVYDPLSIRIGEFITLLAKIVVAHDYQGRPVPKGLGLFSMFLTGAKYLSIKNTNYTGMFPNRTSSTSLNPPVFSDYGWSWITNLFTFQWSNVTQDYTLAIQKQQKLTNMRAFLQSVNPSMNTSSDLVQASLNGEVCDPRDRSCLDCEIVVGSVETIIEVILNCVQDLTNTKRFNLDISKVDLERDNTFLQANDTLKCLSPPLVENENFILTGFLDFLDLFGLDSRYWLARTKCYLTNFDDEDPHSFLFYINKLTTCDPVYDVSAHRGRSGAGLKNAFIYVTLGIIVLFALSSLCLPIIPTFWISLLVWFLLTLFVAYWWSPMCFFPMPPIPIPTLPDALADDLYTELRDMIPVNCTSYHPDVTQPECQTFGRTFVDCRDYGFDYAGGRHLAYFLYSIDPELPQSIRDTSIPFLSSLMESPYYDQAFSDVASIHGTPIGEFCYGINEMSILHSLPLLTAIVQFFLISTLAFSFFGLLVVGLATLVFFAALFVDFAAYVITFVTRLEFISPPVNIMSCYKCNNICSEINEQCCKEY